jgi:hypothetical protein
MTHRAAEEAEWSLAGESGVGLRARYVRQAFPRHTHDSFVICVNERGAHASWYRGANVVIPERAVTMVPPGAVHSGQMVPGKPWHYRAMRGRGAMRSFAHFSVRSGCLRTRT